MRERAQPRGGIGARTGAGAGGGGSCFDAVLQAESPNPNPRLSPKAKVVLTRRALMNVLFICRYPF
jgi:hypothetical protein